MQRDKKCPFSCQLERHPIAYKSERRQSNKHHITIIMHKSIHPIHRALRAHHHLLRSCARREFVLDAMASPHVVPLLPPPFLPFYGDHVCSARHTWLKRSCNKPECSLVLPVAAVIMKRAQGSPSSSLAADMVEATHHTLSTILVRLSCGILSCSPEMNVTKTRTKEPQGQAFRQGHRRILSLLSPTAQCLSPSFFPARFLWSHL